MRSESNGVVCAPTRTLHALECMRVSYWMYQSPACPPCRVLDERVWHGGGDRTAQDRSSQHSLLGAIHSPKRF